MIWSGSWRAPAIRRGFWQWRGWKRAEGPWMLDVALGDATASPPPHAGEGQGGGRIKSRVCGSPLPNPPPHAGEGARGPCRHYIIKCERPCPRGEGGTADAE